MKAPRQGLAADAGNRAGSNVGAYLTRINEEIEAIDADLAKLRGTPEESCLPPRDPMGELHPFGAGQPASQSPIGDFQDGRLQNKIITGFVRALFAEPFRNGTPEGQEILHALIDRMEGAAGFSAAPG